jgi:hypothetical protein
MNKAVASLRIIIIIIINNINGSTALSLGLGYFSVP